MSVAAPPLADGTLSLDAARATRNALVAEMAADLLAHSAYADHGDAIMTLVACGYPSFEVHALVDDARQVATQHAVESEMCWP